MKFSIHTFFSLLVLCSLISCSGKSGETVAESAEHVETVDLDAIGQNDCLLGYVSSLDKLLTLELAANLIDQPSAEAKTSYSTVMKNSAYHSIKYSWKSDRIKNMKDLGIKMDIPADNLVILHGIRPMSHNQFKSSYRVPTNEELSHSEKAIDDALEGKSNNQKINEQVDKLDKMNIDKQTQKSNAKKVGGIVAKVAQAYQDVEGIGDAASWNSVENRLYVLDKGVEISVTVEISNDEKENKAKSITLVQQLLSICK